ncbi:hypothetical protein [Sphaerimonospora thailandensis]|uniref:Uncharacterized protein n=1 Tax=Sphaerimonospora thailandensis TaxID=795644 RepID=A0A8J3R6E3_9ACTN|nr:hypothetical protein [Sphaerimonospora thailandensis]GIH70136.1 hypothetical protein Mth01_23890 [Sphaerimonospora thailandensis]
MPALAVRIGGGPQPEQRLRDLVIARLAAEFVTVPAAVLSRLVADVWVCAEHLGLDVTPEIVERVARERLLGLVNSTPPRRSRA